MSKNSFPKHFSYPELRSKFPTATATASLRFAVNRKRQPQQLWNEEKVKGGPFSFSKKFCKIFVCGQRPDRNRNSNRNRDRQLAVVVNRNRNSGYGNKSKTCTSPLHILLHEDVQILLFWNNSVDVPAFISCWKNLLHETLIIRCFRSSLKKYAHTFSSNFLLSPLLKCFRKEKHFAKNQLCPCLQPLLLNFVPLKYISIWNYPRNHPKITKSQNFNWQ